MWYYFSFVFYVAVGISGVITVTVIARTVAEAVSKAKRVAKDLEENGYNVSSYKIDDVREIPDYDE